jgi:hypothetical protein
MGGESIITQKNTVDEEYDQRWGIGPNGYGTTGSYKASPIDILSSALKSFMAANNGLEPTEPSQLLPYVSTPGQQAALQKITEQFNTLPPGAKNRLETAVQQLKALPDQGAK